ncbi:MAG: kelch repeat-containing protein [Anaerovorax sp.]|nr:kelch repeat-containing protein [Anaerovorax sp.]
MKRFIAIIMTLCMVLGMSSIGAFGAEEEEWKREAVIPSKNTGFSVCAIADKIYIIGGQSEFNNTLNTVDIYDLKTKKWTSGEPMPTARRFMDIAVYGQKIYALGGMSEDTVCSVMEIYDTETNIWETAKAMPFSMYDRKAVTKEINGKIYIIRIVSNTESSVDIYDIKKNTWSKGTSMANLLGDIKGVSKQNCIYVLSNNFERKTTDIAIYNTETDTWKTGMTFTGYRGDAAAGIVGSKIYLMGGYDAPSNKFLKSVEIYDTETNTSSVGTPLPRERNESKSVTIGEIIYLIGGRSNTIESLQVGAQTTTPKLSVLLNIGETVQLSTSYNLANNANYTWSSTNEAVATVDANGKVTAVAVGEADIYAQNSDGTFKEYIPVRVVEGIADELRLAVHLKVGEKAKLYLTDDSSEVTWSSMDESVATVSSDGQVTGIKKGLAIIQGELAGQTYQIYVRVNG